MSIDAQAPTLSAAARPSVREVPLRRVMSLVRRGGPLGLLDELGEAQGEITRLRLGPFTPYLVTRPEHLQQILRTNAGNYPRGAAMWQALGRLTGDGIAGEGPQWHASREILRGAFSGSQLAQAGEQMSDSIVAAVEEMAARSGPDRPVDAGVEMTRVVQRVVDPVFFGRLIPEGEGDRLGEAIATAMGSLLWRMAMPFVPHAIPLPGDRAFRRATRTVHEILRPVVAAARSGPRDGQDVVTRLSNGVGADGAPLTDDQVCQDIIALFVAGSESSAIGLTWIWAALAAHPQVAERVRAEVDQVIGSGRPGREHVRRLGYTQQVLREVMRIHSVGWAVPRMATEDDVLGGVPIPAGSTLVVSPYLTHRLAEFWPDPLRFDPGRFERDQVQRRHPLAYLPFGDGVHKCLGEAFFYQEATLIVAALLSRYQVKVADSVMPKLSLTLQPRDPVRLIVTPR
ncbi:cytochrome P450 [Actinomadura macrotermitis]|uniref:Epi-isozizaene 5-monooxygenase/(E)-beta-farnesene synthase n=1 Tax=Actinomadura macrotermitis TaxID=2585200 RepID=A0A7K0BYL1_9ACTN|nr:cytochrome P450 [Actinomadura macrotermitis]MQY06263.1 Epi-isozizaene 5-monooxygenase/(E)-beta-farnesene synthase [Actinomadura macrotermitis]